MYIRTGGVGDDTKHVVHEKVPIVIIRTRGAHSQIKVTCRSNALDCRRRPLVVIMKHPRAVELPGG